MGDALHLSNWDTLALMVPFLAVLAISMLRLDERFAAPRQAPRARRSFCGVDSKDRPFLSDPDGKPWRKNIVRQIEGRLERFPTSE